MIYVEKIDMIGYNLYENGKLKVNVHGKAVVTDNLTKYGIGDVSPIV